MNDRWALAKWVPDLERNEPVNIGVVVWTQGKVLCRFRGQTAEGEVDGRRIGHIQGHRPVTEMYRRWVEYWATAAARGRDLEHLTRRRGGDAFYLDPAGATLEGNVSGEALLDAVYKRLVADELQDATPGTATFKDQVASVLRRADLLGDPNFHRKYNLRLTNDTTREFPYAWVNGHRTVGYLLGDATPAATDLALWRLSATPPDVGTVVFLAPGADDDDPAARQIQRRVGHIAPLDQVEPSDVREMFLADPTRKVLA